MTIVCRRLPRHRPVGHGSPQQGKAGPGKRADLATRILRGADQAAEVHQGLVEGPRLARRQQFPGQLLDPLPAAPALERLVNIEEAGEDPHDIGIDDRHILTEGDAGDRGGGIRARCPAGNAGPRPRRGSCRHAAPRAAARPGAGPRPAVIAQPLPILEDLLPLGGRQGGHVRKPGDPRQK